MHYKVKSYLIKSEFAAKPFSIKHISPPLAVNPTTDKSYLLTSGMWQVEILRYPRIEMRKIGPCRFSISELERVQIIRGKQTTVREYVDSNGRTPRQ